jgi:hypothetical protein
MCSCFPFLVVWVLLRSRDTTSIFDDANSGVPKQHVPVCTCVSRCVSSIWSSSLNTLPSLSVQMIVVFDESINLLVNISSIQSD